MSYQDLSGQVHRNSEANRPTLKDFQRTQSWRQDAQTDARALAPVKRISIASIPDIVPPAKADSVMSISSLRDSRRRSIVDYGPVPRISNAEVIAEAMAMTNPYTLPPITGNRNTINDLERRASISPPSRRMSLNLSVDSSIQEFRAYHQNLSHPANVLRVGSAEEDREAVTEFDVLCNEILSVTGEVESSLEDLTTWKDDFLKQSVPSNVKLTLALLFSRMLRTKSDLHEPIFELIKQIKLYSRPWVDKRNAILELEKDYQRHTQVLDVAIRKLELMNIHTEQIKSQHRVALWERLTSRLFDYMPPEDLDRDSVKFSQIDIFTRPVKGELTKLQEEDESESYTDESEQEPINYEEFNKLVASIRDYIAQDPPAKAKLKASIRQLERTLKKQYPGYQRRMSSILRRPFPTIPKLNYLSFSTGTILKQNLRKFPIPRAWSEIDLRAFTSDFPKGKKDRKARRFNEEGSLPLRKSNSSHTLYILGKKAQLRKNVTIPVSSKEKVRLKKTLAKSAYKAQINRWRAFDDVSDDSNTSDGTEDDESVIDASDAYLDRDFLGDLNPQDLEDAIQKFYLENPSKKPGRETQDGDEESLLGQFDHKKEFFSMQEVIELTLLHAQQVHFLQKFYEQKMEDFQERLSVLQSQNSRAIDDYNRKLQIQQEKSQNALAELTKKFNDQMEQVQASAEKTTRPNSKDFYLKQTSQQEIAHHSSSSVDKYSKSNTPPKKAIVASAKSDLNKRRSIAGPPHFTKRQSRSSTAAEFMERLRQFTDDALKKRESIRIQIIQEEKLSNERKLGHITPFTQSEDAPAHMKAVPGLLTAEFMPSPGTIKKPRGSWSNGLSGLWGGRFKSISSPKADGQKLNILNLFDVAMNIEIKKSEECEDDQ